MNRMNKQNSNLPIVLWVVVLLLGMGMLFARFVFADQLWITIVMGVGFVIALGALIRANRRSLRSRSAAFGLNSAVGAILVFSILAVTNYLAARYPFKKDFTRNQVHTLSDQTAKVVKNLKQEVHANYFAKTGQREQVRPLLENLSDLNPKFKVEYVDPDKEPARAKTAGVKKYGTLQLAVGTKESKVEEVNEEKVTNALIKLLKDKAQTLCAVTGHGERNFGATDAEGYETAKRALADQSYEVKDLSLVQEGKVPENCDAIAILGPTKSFFDAELKILRDYFEKGGRAIVGLDTNLKGADYSPEFQALLKEWHIAASPALIVDPVSRALGVDAAVPLLATYSKDSPITKDFTANSYFPFSRPIEIIPGAPSSLNLVWLAQTTSKAWGEMNKAQLTSGQVSFDKGQDKEGPLTVAVSVEGKLSKDSKASRNTRLVVFGTSTFETNNYSRFGGNQDFFLNSVSWLLEDESLISIRAKEEGPGKIELTAQAGSFIFLLCVIAIPLFIAVAGVVIWYFRRRL